MSANPFDLEYLPRPGERPIHARSRGSLAATMIGAASVIFLGASLLFVGKRPADDAQAALAPQPLPVPTAHAHAPDDVTGSIGGGGKQNANFDLSSPEFAKEKKSYSARALDQGAGREDSLTLGQFAQGGPYLRLDIRQTSGGKLGSSDFYLDIANHATQAGLSVARIGQPGPLVSRFGAFEAADAKLSQQASGERACFVMRLIDPRQSLEIAGLACGTAANPLDRRAMGCVVDRLDYLSNGVNKPLDQFFLNAELERGKGCAGAGAKTPTASTSTTTPTASRSEAKSVRLEPRAITPALKSASTAPPVKRKKKTPGPRLGAIPAVGVQARVSPRE